VKALPCVQDSRYGIPVLHAYTGSATIQLP
jgi:hypothetical protein